MFSTTSKLQVPTKRRRDLSQPQTVKGVASKKPYVDPKTIQRPDFLNRPVNE
jgi:hypothetical protein